ncbi:hypothetical protein JX265_008457 [Neoarthrinium moseri]|uniref:Beta-lactamase-related domain-containing protein n=1 Tax=Neoarthrinium moseri TaxID=1658444 RepID=A0A9Q0AK69_9PEZI|nr:hypothetical protein JX265_008457 [Neoarthrinium moseri]
METFEAKLAQATDPKNRDLLGALGLVVNSKGETLYQHASGYQSLAPDAAPLDPDSTVFMASAGKFVTHIAVLQLVERGVIGIDDPVYKLLPELEKLEIISPSIDEEVGFTLRPIKNQITLRHMLTHSSGIGPGDDALTTLWKAATPPQEFPEGTSGVVKLFSTPLLFEPGEDWSYGHSIHWLQPLVERAYGKKFTQCMQELVFDPMGLKHTSYLSHLHPEISGKLLQCVKRQDDGGVALPAPDEALQGLVMSISDVKTLLVDLIGKESRLLKKEHVDLLFEPAFGPSTAALETVLKDEDTFAKTIGYKEEQGCKVNFTCAGALVTEGHTPESQLPAGTLTWNGWPNLIWTMNREKGIATLFATQLIPVDDEKTLTHMIEFLKSAWTTFG